MTNSMVRPWRSFKAPLKAKLASEKDHSHCLAVCCPTDPLELSESWWDHYIWEVCSASQWDTLKAATPAASRSTARAQFFFLHDKPSSAFHNQCFTSRTNLARTFCLICHIHLNTHQLSLTSSSIFNFFAGKTLLQLAGGRKCFQRIHWIPNRRFLCYRNKQTYFSLAKMCWL